ncbi:hypothetical protein FOA52_008437 [Chlamydomonas sp. UWO 241]|nr:hypothetical protein FOA52_008437 [Chlamydomonas sp. UWO 241]
MQRSEWHQCHSLWTVEGEQLRVGLDAAAPPTSGGAPYVGFGLTEAGGMKGGDLWVVGDEAALQGSLPSGATAKSLGGYMVLDTHSMQFEQPIADAEQNVSLLSVDVSSVPGRWLVSLTRALQTCGSEDLAVDTRLPTAVVWSIGDWSTGHGRNRGGGYVRFDGSAAATLAEGQRTTESASEAELASAEVLELAMPNVTVPDEATTFLCQPMYANFSKVRHIIKINGIDRSSSKGLVHHMLLYYCASPPPITNATFTCWKMPQSCQEIVYAWVPGSGEWDFPPEAAVPLYPDSHYVLQIHYTNRYRLPGQFDASGVRLTTTLQLRERDVWVVMLGTTAISLPPGMEQVSMTPQVCGATCSGRMPKPLRILKVSLHMHETGTNMTLRHFRNGTELQPLTLRNSYDYAFQVFGDVALETGVWQPGDSLITSCTYNTEGRVNTTSYGPETSDEMCFAFLVVHEMDADELIAPPPGAKWTRESTGYTVFESSGRADRLAYCTSQPVEETQMPLAIGLQVASRADPTVVFCASVKEFGGLKSLVRGGAADMEAVVKLYMSGVMPKQETAPNGFAETWWQAPQCRGGE